MLSDDHCAENLQLQDVTERSIGGWSEDIDTFVILSLFCVLMGRFGGNLALNLGTFVGALCGALFVLVSLEFFQSSLVSICIRMSRFHSYLEIHLPVFLVTPNNRVVGFHKGLILPGTGLQLNSAIIVLRISVIKTPAYAGVLFFHINLRACGCLCVTDQMAIDIALPFVLLHLMYINQD